ncbi:MAG: flagellar biosynthesis repressor FlbT [Rhodospirillales bacterium]|nr:flagellar biosynthesis repressor FlbT [Rhodospirillales bacterium]MCB9965190.1 flagellar biosynthesis repressor FlbT [Rhodospirillales bacterium]MCB9973209.1 flagellar biosynthesis repressor FlbT [Rhodospirillales bacterium]MCB9979531.1 flagellar biosynthesis repressor FlbT [Rhodospirillales bacterium]
MALVIDLKPNEKILVGTAVITNDSQRTRLHIAGDAAILREKDVMREEEADSPCKKIYFLVQCMYLARNPKEYHQKYFDLVRDIQMAAPSTTGFFLNINEKIIEGHYYKAMKDARELINYEQELMTNARKA